MFANFLGDFNPSRLPFRYMMYACVCVCAWCRLGGGSCFEGFELCMSVARSSSFRAGRGSGRASQATSLSYANALSFQHRRRLLHGNAPDRTGPLHFRSRLETQEPRPIKRNLTLVGLMSLHLYTPPIYPLTSCVFCWSSLRETLLRPFASRTSTES